MPTSPTEPLNQAALTLLTQQQPLLDVRAPGEFQLGQLPNSVNAPILNDEERARIGTTYKQEGHDAAVALGHQLVSGEIKNERVAAEAFCQTNPDAMIMCWRGGQRSLPSNGWPK